MRFFQNLHNPDATPPTTRPQGARRSRRLRALVLALAVFTLVGVPGTRGLASVLPSGLSPAAPPVDAGAGSSPVAVTSDGERAPMFHAPSMVPGDMISNCIVVSYDGTTASTEIALYGSVGGDGLADYLDLIIEVGDGGSFDDCDEFRATGTVFDGTLADFGERHTDSSTGLLWSPTASGETLTYRFTLTLQNDNRAQGKHALADVTWEATSG